MTETLRWISPGEYPILLRYKKNPWQDQDASLFVKTIGIEFHSLRFIRNGKQLFRICRWSNSKSNRHCTRIGYTAVIGTEKSKDKTDTAGISWNILLSLTKTDWKEKRKWDNLDEKAGDTKICRRKKNASNETGLLGAVDGIKLKGF